MNVLVALAWPNHVHHARAVGWFAETHREGWATCSSTETGFVRVSSNTRILPEARTPQQAIALLVRMRKMAGHRFWSDDVSPAEDVAGIFAGVVGFRQVTDAWLLTLAHRHHGRLATFDRGIAELEATGSVARVELIG